MFASICIQLQELTKEKAHWEETFFLLFVLVFVLFFNWEQLLSQNTNFYPPQKRKKKRERWEWGGCVWGRDKRREGRGWGEGERSGKEWREERGGWAALLTTGRPGTALSELNLVPGWLSPALQEGRAPGFPPYQPPPALLSPLWCPTKSFSALSYQSNTA